MRTRLLAFILSAGLLACVVGYAIAQTSIGAIYGGSVDCTGCPSAVLTSITVLCNGSVNCPEALNVDPSNTANLYGVNSPNCVRSTNSGVAWGQCTSQPPLTGGAILAGIAATSNGTVISAASTGAACVIGRSTNATTSWSGVYNAAPICQGDLGQSVVRCVGTTCIIGTNAGGRPGILASTDDGQTWNVVYQSAAKAGIPMAIFFDGTRGIVITNFRDSDNIIYTVTGVGGWADSPNALGITLCYGSGFSSSFGPVAMCSTAGTRRLVNVANGTITNLTIPNFNSDGFARFVQLNGNQYITNGSASCGMWATSGIGTVFSQLSCNAAFNTIGGEMLPGGNVIYNTTRFNGVNAILRSLHS